MQCASSICWSSKSCFVAFLAVATVSSTRTHWREDTLPPSPEQNRCLLQFAHDVATIEVQQPMLTNPDNDTVLTLKKVLFGVGQPTAVDPAQAAGAFPDKDVGDETDQQPQSVFALSFSAWARIARVLAAHWVELVILFCVVFAFIFPPIHWYLEHREEERAIFIQAYLEHRSALATPRGEALAAPKSSSTPTQSPRPASTASAPPTVLAGSSATTSTPTQSPRAAATASAPPAIPTLSSAKGKAASTPPTQSPRTVPAGSAASALPAGNMSTARTISPFQSPRTRDRFAALSISPTGGQNKIAKLIENDRPKLRRPIKVAVRTFAISLNIFFLVQQDVLLLRGAEAYYAGSNASLPSKLQRYLELTDNTSLISVRHAVFVTAAELIGLAAMLIWMTYRFSVFWICRNNPKVKFDAFISLYDSFDCFSLLAGFSALRLVNIAHPALVIRKFQVFMARPFIAGRTFKGIQLFYFIATRMTAAVLGALAFGVKLAFVSVQVTIPITNLSHWWTETIWRWLLVMMLLFQTLSAVGVENVMWWRMVLLVVEGGNRRVTLEKIRLSQVYLSKVMQLIYEEYFCKGNYYGFCLLILTFDHIDLQHLLIDEDAKKAMDEDIDVMAFSPDALGDMLSVFG